MASCSNSSGSPVGSFKEDDVIPAWKTKNVQSWTSEEVKDWLSSIGFEDEAALFSKEQISGQALMRIEKAEIKEMGIQPMGRRILIMSKISQLIKSQEEEKGTEVNPEVEKASMKKKITRSDKRNWDARSKTTYLEKTSFIIKEAEKVWPGNEKVYFKNNTSQKLKLEELVSNLTLSCTIPHIGFGRESIRQHIIQWAHEKNRRISDGYDFEAEHTPAKRARKDHGSSSNSEQELDLGPSRQETSKESAELGDITIQSSIIVMLCYFGTESMRDIVVTKQLYPLAKELNVKYRSLSKYQLCVPLAKALISKGFVEVKVEPGQKINYCCLKRSNIVVVKTLKIAKHQSKSASSSKEEGASEDDEDGYEQDTDSVSTGSSVCD